VFDAVIIGAGISGSVTAKMIAEEGYSVLLVDSAVPPRDKVCSGVQLKYMEKLIGEKIPNKVLCSNKLRRVRLTRPSGKILEGSMPMLNYWRRNFDNWLNERAIKAGADTLWGTKVTALEILDESVKVHLGEDIVEAKYYIGADGLSPSSFSRRRLAPEKYSEKVTGASMNYYYRGDSVVKPDILYLYYRTGLSDLMYSWLYFKDDLLVIGTSSTENLYKYANIFLETVKRDFNLVGEEIKRDGFSTHSRGGVILGKGKALLVGDAAGLLDLYRGIGMDTAALSGRICAKSIIEALKSGDDALNIYRRKASRLVKSYKLNERKQEKRFASNKSLENSFKMPNIISGMVKMKWASLWNRICKPEDIILLPP
jgi:flavin-dependent dehydrogenase